MNTLRPRRSGLPAATVLRFALVCLAGTVACQGRPSGETRRASPVPAARSGSSGSDLLTAATVASCGGFGVRDAADLLGVPGATLRDRSNQLGPTLRMCNYGTLDGAQLVSFSLSLSQSVTDARRDYAQMKDNIPIAESAQKASGVASSDSALIEIGGLGDEALWTNVNGSLTVRRGNLTIQVMAPRDRKQQIAVADKLLSLIR